MREFLNISNSFAKLCCIGSSRIACDGNQLGRIRSAMVLSKLALIRNGIGAYKAIQVTAAVSGVGPPGGQRDAS